MFNYFKSEIWRLTHKRSSFMYYVFLIFIYIISILFLAIQDLYTPNTLLESAQSIISLLPVFVGTQVFLAVYGDDLKDRMLIKIIGTGLHRLAYLLVKTVMFILYSAIVFLILGAVYLISFMIAGGHLAVYAQDIQSIAVMGIITYLKTLAFSQIAAAFLFCFQKTVPALVLFLTLIMGVVLFVFNIMAYVFPIIEKFTNYSVSTLSQNAQTMWINFRQFDTSFIIGITIYIVLAFASQIMIFKNRDIKG